LQAVCIDDVASATASLAELKKGNLTLLVESAASAAGDDSSATLAGKVSKAPNAVLEILRTVRIADSLDKALSIRDQLADLELPQLLRALDPRLLAVPLLVRGEAGSGRSLLARYVHSFGGGSQGGFARLPCEAVGSAREVREAIQEAAGRPAAVCLENLDRLPLSLQRELQAWIEIGMPTGLTGARRTRWIATVAAALLVIAGGVYAATIAPGFVPTAFANPIFIDVDGNGRFDAPGLPPPPRDWRILGTGLSVGIAGLLLATWWLRRRVTRAPASD